MGNIVNRRNSSNIKVEESAPTEDKFYDITKDDCILVGYFSKKPNEGKSKQTVISIKGKQTACWVRVVCILDPKNRIDDFINYYKDKLKDDGILKLVVYENSKKEINLETLE